MPPTTAAVEQGIESLLDAQTEGPTKEVEAEETEKETVSADETEVEESEVDEPVDDVDEQDQDEPDEEDDEKSDTTDDAIESLSDLAEALEMSPDDLAETIKGKVKINGEEREVTLAEMVAGYQKGEAYEERKAKLQEERETLDREISQAKQHVTNQMQQTVQMGQLLRNQIIGEANSADMQKLRTENPGEYAARMQELTKRGRDLDEALQWQAQQLRTQQDSLTAEQQEQKEHELEQEMQELKTKLPNFDKAAAVKYMQSQGFKDLNVEDHQWLVTLDKAMKFDQLQEKGKTASKKVKTLPKVQKPGKPQSVRKNKVTELRSRLRKTGKGKDFTQLVEHQLNQGLL